MDFDLKKPLLFIAILIGVFAYIQSNYTPQDILRFARKNPEMSIAPALDYYVGTGYYMRSDFGKATEAYTQLLTDYTTNQYTEDALFRLGVSYDEMFKWSEARDAFEQYMIRFPDGKEKNIVQSRYDQIKFK